MSWPTSFQQQVIDEYARVCASTEPSLPIKILQVDATWRAGKTTAALLALRHILREGQTGALVCFGQSRRSAGAPAADAVRAASRATTFARAYWHGEDGTTVEWTRGGGGTGNGDTMGVVRFADNRRLLIVPWGRCTSPRSLANATTIAVDGFPVADDARSRWRSFVYECLFPLTLANECVGAVLWVGTSDCLDDAYPRRGYPTWGAPRDADHLEPAALVHGRARADLVVDARPLDRASECPFCYSLTVLHFDNEASADDA